MSRSPMNNSISLSSLFRLPPSSSAASLHSNGNSSFSREGDTSQSTIYSIGSSPRRRPGRPSGAFQEIIDDLSTSQSFQSTTSQSNNHGHTRRISFPSTSSAMTVRPINATPSRRRSRRTHRPSISVSSSTTHTSASQGPRRSLASRSSCSTSSRPDGPQQYQYPSSRSHASIKTHLTHRSTHRSLASTSYTSRRRRAPTLDIVNRSYIVFRKKLFRFKRQERVLLLDKQWVHILPSSTKKLNYVFDTRKSVSYHIRLLASAKVKPRRPIIIVEFKRGSRGRLKQYNLKVKNQSTACEIVKALWQSKIQFSEP